MIVHFFVDLFVFVTPDNFLCLFQYVVIQF